MAEIVKPTINRELFRRYKRGDLNKEELADFLYSMAQVTMDEELKRQHDLSEKRMNEYINNVARLFRAAFCMVMHDKAGYGAKRLTDRWREIQDLMDSFARGYLSIEDMEDTLRKECKIKLEEGEDENNGLSE